ncbi:hypothetical protein LTR04_002498 [Oleoguttula sp. CCFEE 6159]|nr:hypothetical protein LTR04_002498 [Oleoguttula sp. CCFEE 6159]
MAEEVDEAVTVSWVEETGGLTTISEVEDTGGLTAVSLVEVISLAEVVIGGAADPDALPEGAGDADDGDDAMEDTMVDIMVEVSQLPLSQTVVG